MTIDRITKRVKEYNPAADTDLLEMAYDFAKNAHEGQMRKNGELT